MEGGRGFPAACTLPAADGMRIRSESEDVDELRRSVMQMLIAEHPNGCLTCHRVDICGPSDVCLRHVSVNDRCVTCPKNERCEFKDTVRYLGMELESPLNYKYKQVPLEVSDPFYDRDYNLCIACGRCVRACEEIRGDDAICFTERSGKALIGTLVWLFPAGVGAANFAAPALMCARWARWWSGTTNGRSPAAWSRPSVPIARWVASLTWS